MPFPIVPTPTTAMPPAPDPTNRSTFNSLAYPWSLAQETLRQELEVQAGQTYQNAQAAEAYADQAQSGLSNFQGNWASGTTYSQGQSVYYAGSFWFSLANSNTNHAPALGIWWYELGLINLRMARMSVSTDTTLTAGLIGRHIVATATLTIDADDPELLEDGFGVTISATGGRVTLELPFEDGDVTKTLAKGGTYILVTDGEAFWIVASYIPEPEFGTLSSATVVNASASQAFIGSLALTATRGFVLRKNSSGYPVVDLVSETGAVLGTSAALDGTNVASERFPTLSKISDSSAIVFWIRETGNRAMACVVTFSGTTVTPGTAVDVSTTAATSVSGCALSSTEAILVWGDSGDVYVKAKGLDLSGSVITANSVYNLATVHVASECRVVKLNSTQAQLLYHPASANTIIYSTTVTKAAGVLTFPSITMLCQMVSVVSVAVSSTGVDGRILAVYGENFATGARASLVDVSGTGSSAVFQIGLESNVSPTGSYHGGHLVPLSANCYLRLTAGVLTVKSLVASVLEINGDSVKELNVGKTIARSVTGFSCMVLGNSIVIVYADSGNSNYPTIRTLGVGNIV
jgi:hypothetical protein